MIPRPFPLLPGHYVPAFIFTRPAILHGFKLPVASIPTLFSHPKNRCNPVAKIGGHVVSISSFIYATKIEHINIRI